MNNTNTQHPLQPTVTHVRAGCDLYIGRTMPRQHLVNTGWGNPFKETIFEQGQRLTPVAQYRRWIMTQPHLLARIRSGELDGKRLGCWCKPRYECHGDALVEVWRQERLPLLGGDSQEMPTSRHAAPVVPAPKTIKTISLTQPWATLLACGAKTYETRSWPLRLPRGTRVAIHAAKSFPASAKALMNDWPFKEALEAARDAGYFEPDGTLPLGKVIAVARFVECLPTESVVRKWLVSDDLWEHAEEEAFGNYSPGRYAFRFEEATPVVPIPARGQLGIWTFEIPPEGLRPVEVKGRLEWFDKDVGVEDDAIAAQPLDG